jgi:hypothetical protein
MKPSPLLMESEAPSASGLRWSITVAEIRARMPQRSMTSAMVSG